MQGSPYKREEQTNIEVAALPANLATTIAGSTATTRGVTVRTYGPTSQKIDAEVPAGIDKAKSRTLLENANTLGFIDKALN